MSLMKKLCGILVVASLAAASGFAFSEEKAVETVKDRIAPVGKVCMAGEPCAAAPAAPAGSGPKTGKELFGTVCTTCHGTGVMGAPKFGSAADWGPRAAKGLDTLYTHALNGFNSMPPKGTCASCSDDEIKGAVKYMVDNSK